MVDIFVLYPIVLAFILLLFFLVGVCLYKRKLSRGAVFRDAQPATLTPASGGRHAAYPQPSQAPYSASPSHPAQTPLTAYPAGERVHLPPWQEGGEHYSGNSPRRPPQPQGAPLGVDDAPPSYESVMGAGAGQQQQPFNPSFQ